MITIEGIPVTELHEWDYVRCYPQDKMGYISNVGKMFVGVVYGFESETTVTHPSNLKWSYQTNSTLTEILLNAV